MANARQSVFSDPFDELLRGFLFRPFPFAATSASPFPIDVSENQIAYRIKADLPGVRRQDIEVSVEANTVTIAAEVRGDSEPQSADRALRAERYVGKLARSITLAEDVEGGAAEARYVDGVLELLLPKKSATTRTRVAVG